LTISSRSKSSRRRVPTSRSQIALDRIVNYTHFLMDLGHRATTVKFLIRDRAGQFTSSFDAVFTAEGIRILASPPQAPRANAICERMLGTLRRELLDRLLIVNEHHLRQVLTEYLQHYNTARPHRSLDQLTPAQVGTQPPNPVNLAEHRIHRKQVLGGLTREYYIAALPPSAATGERRSPSESYFRAPHPVRPADLRLGVAAAQHPTPRGAGSGSQRSSRPRTGPTAQAMTAT
jgi:Integrase core domain